MTKRADGWISRRGQTDAAAAVELVLDRQPQEPVQQIADELIEDSPYQARQLISDASLAELAQGMQATGFQGVLVVRPHGDVAKRRQGRFELVYGHRRRAAWQHVCQERGEPSLLPVVVREISDAQMLTIGAQENLQRQDLDPVEEAQIVAWAERMFFDKNQTEIGAIFGKSSDWVSTRSRIHKLPEPLKEVLRRRPRTIKQMLELASLYAQDPSAAHKLAHQVMRDNLTVEILRRRIAEQRSNLPAATSECESAHNRRASTTSVHNVTTEVPKAGGVANETISSSHASPPHEEDKRSHIPAPELEESKDQQSFRDPKVLVWLQDAAATLKMILMQIDHLPHTLETAHALETAEDAIRHIRDSLLTSTVIRP